MLQDPEPAGPEGRQQQPGGAGQQRAQEDDGETGGLLQPGPGRPPGRGEARHRGHRYIPTLLTL